jgi:osmotically inducible protein OsmC
MAFRATATWTGDLKGGKGVYSLGSGVATDVPYLYIDRFENAGGASPDELAGAALASCFVMYLSAVLGDTKAESLDAEAKVSLGKDDTGPVITDIRIKLNANIPGIDKAKFDELVAATEKGCPISRLFAGNTEIKVSATLER